MDCSKAREVVNAYIDGMLSDVECTEYEEHISCCDACHEEYDMLKKIVFDLSRTTAPLPEGFARRAHANLTGKKAMVKKFDFSYRMGASLVAAAFVLAVVGKFGVYDIYKKVVEQNQSTTAELSIGTAENTVDNTEKIKEGIVSQNQHKTTLNTPSNTKQENILLKSSDISIEENVVANIEVASQEEAPVSDEIAENNISAVALAEETLPNVQAAEGEFNGENNMMGARMIAPEESVQEQILPEQIPTDEEIQNPQAITESIIENGVETSGADEMGEDTETPIATELIPAIVLIDNSGDASKEMFKKYLATFLDSGNITENEEGVTITIPAERYESVMAQISANEYVKSVTDGTPFEGIAKINIK